LRSFRRTAALLDARFLRAPSRPVARRRVAEDRLFGVALFAATRFLPARFFTARPANRFFLVAMLRLP
jgi:hypothetical protein